MIIVPRIGSDRVYSIAKPYWTNNNWIYTQIIDLTTMLKDVGLFYHTSMLHNISCLKHKVHLKWNTDLLQRIHVTKRIHPPIYSTYCAILATLQPSLWGSKQPQNCVALRLFAILQLRDLLACYALKPLSYITEQSCSHLTPSSGLRSCWLSYWKYSHIF